MNRTMNCLMLLAAIAVMPACLDESTTDTQTGAPGLRPDKPQPQPQPAASTLRSGLHAQLLKDLGQLAGSIVRPDALHRMRVALPTEWSESNGELTIVHVNGLDLWSVQVFRDDGELLCAIDSTATGVVSDTCGSHAD